MRLKIKVDDDWRADRPVRREDYIGDGKGLLAAEVWNKISEQSH